MKSSSLAAALLFRREALRQRFSSRAMALALVVNLSAIVLFGSWIIWLFERGANPTLKTYRDALWLTFVTITTIGFGDSYPITAGGRLSAVVILGMGIGMVGVFISTRAAIRAQEFQKEERGLDSYVKSQDHYVVCGWNERAPHALDRLKEDLAPTRTQIVLLCDREDKPYDDDYVFFVRGSAVRERDLVRANIARARAVILLADESGGAGGDPGEVDSKTVLAALTIRALNPQAKMTAEILEPENTHHLELAGVGEILDSNVISGNLLAQSAVSFGMISLVTDLITRKPGEKIRLVKVTPGLVGMDRAGLVDHVRLEFDGKLLSVLREDGPVREGEEFTLRPDDVVLVLPGTEREKDS